MLRPDPVLYYCQHCWPKRKGLIIKRIGLIIIKINGNCLKNDQRIQDGLIPAIINLINVSLINYTWRYFHGLSLKLFNTVLRYPIKTLPDCLCYPAVNPKWRRMTIPQWIQDGGEGLKLNRQKHDLEKNTRICQIYFTNT